LSRVEVEVVTLNTVPQDIAPLIESVAERLSPQFQDKGVALNVEIPPALPKVSIDEDRISQVLINLLGNALQYTPENGQATLAVQKTDEDIRVRIQDTGIGITAEHPPHLFTRFYRVDKYRSRTGGGTGISLTIAKHLVEAYEGRIWAQSQETGKGSTFTFTLPTQI
jgi:histidine kinase